jgi:hypothetical protein
MIQIDRLITLTAEDGYQITVSPSLWNFTELLVCISYPDRKVSQIKLLRLAFPNVSLRDCKMIVEAVLQTNEE